MDRRSARWLFVGALLACGPAVAASCPELLQDSYRPLAGEDPVRLCDRFAGKVLLVVNTASKCGFTPQYEGLEALHEAYAARGLAVVGFPSNDFKEQEPGSEAEIRDFCTLTYGVRFPMYEKVEVIGPNATPFYKQLKAATGVEPGWNFHKYLIHRDGKTVESFTSKVKPNDPALVAAIEKALAE